MSNNHAKFTGFNHPGVQLVAFLVVLLLGIRMLMNIPAPIVIMKMSEEEKIEAGILERLNLNTYFVYDPEAQTCWAQHATGTVKSIVHVPCEIARRRMSPTQLEKLESAEVELGHAVP